MNGKSPHGNELIRECVRLLINEQDSIGFDAVQKGGMKLGSQEAEDEPKELSAGLIDLPNPMRIKGVVPVLVAASVLGSKDGYQNYLQRNGFSQLQAKAAAAFIPTNWLKMCEWQERQVSEDTEKAVRTLSGDEEGRVWLGNWIKDGTSVVTIGRKVPKAFNKSIKGLSTLKGVYDANKNEIHKSGLMLITQDKDIPPLAYVIADRIGTELAKEAGIDTIKSVGKTAGKVGLKILGKSLGVVTMVIDIANIVKLVSKLDAADTLFKENIEEIFSPASPALKVSSFKGGIKLRLGGDAGDSMASNKEKKEKKQA